ncbi:MAG: 16S rRNA (cytidine(1402)-2'-O)-methyltransferase [Desulfobacca sp.]|uniref:16S rRNA (cytidine(1402)-2'-O)-methyltransferase n=1 Tax=Desulfobacca sp. TaxID=2067990 RepID=UPI0040499124
MSIPEPLPPLSASTAAPGHLYVVATPIGNLADITQRALGILGSVDLIAAEDTRRTRKLLAHYQIRSKLLSYHSHNAASRGPELIQALQSGQAVAVVSDAGTPGFSDPGALLVDQAWEAGIPVVAIPGPAAALAALSMSGFSGEVTFIGFLPRQTNKRREELSRLAQEQRVLIFYESPRRLLPTLQDISQTMAERHILVVRELTKMFEQAWRGPVATVLTQLMGEDIRGECTLVLSRPRSMAPVQVDVAGFLLAAAQDASKSGRSLAQEAAAALGVSRRQAYQTYLALQAAGKIPGKMGRNPADRLKKKS